MWLIGRKWKYSDVWSGPVLIDRGLDLSREAVLKERKRRIKLTESLTPKRASEWVGESGNRYSGLEAVRQLV